MPPRSTQQPLLPDWTSGRGAGGSWGRVGGQWEANLGTGPPGTTLTGVGEGRTSWQRRRQLRARAPHARAQPLEQKRPSYFLKVALSQHLPILSELSMSSMGKNYCIWNEMVYLAQLRRTRSVKELLGEVRPKLPDQLRQLPRPFQAPSSSCFSESPGSGCSYFILGFISSCRVLWK